MASDDLRCVLTLEYKYSSFAIYRGDEVEWEQTIRAFDYRQLAQYILNYLRYRYVLLIGEPTAEKICISMGVLILRSDEKIHQIRGRNLISGFPDQIEIGSNELHNQIITVFSSLITIIRFFLEDEYFVDFVDIGRSFHSQPQVPKDLRNEITGIPIQIRNRYGSSPTGLVEYLSQALD